jgi:hypothetical protein
VDFLHHGIHVFLDHGDRDQLLGGGLLFEIGGGGLLLIKELTGGQEAMTRGGSLLGSFGGGNQGVEPLLGDLDVGGRKGDDVRWHEDRSGGGGGDQGVELLLEGLDVGGRKGDGVRRHDDWRRGGGRMNSVRPVS